MKKTFYLPFTIFLVLLCFFGFIACDKTPKKIISEAYRINEEQFNDLILNGSAVLSTTANVTIKCTYGLPEENYLEEMILKISGNLYSEPSKYNGNIYEQYREIEKNNYDENSKTFSGFLYYKNNEDKWIKVESALTKDRILSNCGFYFESWTFADFDFDEENKVYKNNKTLYREGYEKKINGCIEYRPQITFKEITLSFENGKIEKIYYKADADTSIQNAIITLEFYDYGTTSVILPTVE